MLTSIVFLNEPQHLDRELENNSTELAKRKPILWQRNNAYGYDFALNLDEMKLSEPFTEISWMEIQVITICMLPKISELAYNSITDLIHSQFTSKRWEIANSLNFSTVLTISFLNLFPRDPSKP